MPRAPAAPLSLAVSGDGGPDVAQVEAAALTQCLRKRLVEQVFAKPTALQAGPCREGGGNGVRRGLTQRADDGRPVLGDLVVLHHRIDDLRGGFGVGDGPQPSLDGASKPMREGASALFG